MNYAAPTSAANAFAPQRERADGAVVARIEVFDDLAAAEPLWRQLERAGPLVTPYQRFEWVEHWFRLIGRPGGTAPLIVVGTDQDGAPSVIFPFVRADGPQARIARFCGGNHSNLNMPIWRPDATPELTGPRVMAVLAQVAATHNIDLYALLGQPLHWRGVMNPLAALPRQPSPDDVYNGGLGPADVPFKPCLPSGMRKKERKLTKLDGYRCGMARTPEMVDRVLEAFGRQKAVRFAQQGIPNVFDRPGVMDFLRAACLDGLAEGRPAIELHALEGAGEVLAVVGGVSNRQRFSVMFNSITPGEHARMSPGIILMADIIGQCAERGIASFDLGAGHAPYKDYFCTGREQRFDCLLAFSVYGRLIGTAYGAVRGVKRSLKNQPAVMAALQSLRRWTTAGIG